ncbi:MAG: phosphatidylserine/phosphatidylglycerophosphate/cardiolipin synthase family protein [Myxococcales bacterium]|nr:phosphatidylserine/phosphatidylglycerophosphate/cardiolipin synthase family protein [Myxococcales bacterium]
MRPASMFASVFAVLLASSTVLPLVGCALDDEDPGEELGDLGDGKSDSFGIVDKPISIAAGKSKRFSFSADASFRVAVTQPTTAAADRPALTLSLKDPSGDRQTADADGEPTLVIDQSEPGSYSLTVKNVGTKVATAILNVRPLGGFGALPNPNAPIFPDVTWQPPAPDTWPASYVIFNNTGCGHDCTQADQNELGPRSVMIKMLSTAIKDVKQGGTIRISNFNISGSNAAKPVVDAVLWAIQNKGAHVKIVMDEAQNNAMSRTTLLASQGAEVRFLNGMTYSTSVGIMHSKIVAVDDQLVFTGSNNFSGTGLITNEENSVVLRGPTNAERIRSFVCDVDVMFEAGVAPGQPQQSDDARKAAVAKLDACNGTDTWFPPSGVISTGDSITYTNVTKGIAGAKRSISLAPDMLAHPGIVSSLVSRAKKAKAMNQPFTIKLVLDASQEALGNPAFGECVAEAGAQFGLDVQVRYWPGTAEIFQLMHHKFMIIDQEDPTGATLYNGSANYSAKAMKWSFENVTRYTGAPYRQVVDAFTARFGKMFADGKTKDKLAAEDHISAPACPLNVNSL